jgi:hypothetical protein
MKVIKATGLVPVYEPKNASHIFGVVPGVAFEGWKNKTLVIIPEIPEAIETEDFPMPEYDDRDKPSAKKGAEPEHDGDRVVIPEKWEDEHWMTVNKLAKTVAGDDYKVPEGTKATDYDKTVIREELARRADEDKA